MRTTDGQPAPRRGTVAAIGVLWLALVLRVASPGLVEFKYDEARSVLDAQAIARGDRWPLTSGGTSWGIPRPALTLYVLALPAMVTDDPRAAVLWLALLGVAAVAVVWRAGATLFDRPTATFAALLVAVNPWAVHYDRKLWAHPLPLLSALTLLCAAWLVVQRRPRAVLPLLVVLALQGQTHTLGWVVAFAALGPVLLFRPRLSPRHAALGLVAVVLIMLPWLAGLGGLRATLAGIVAQRTVGDGLSADGWGVRFLLWLASGEGLAALLGQQAARLQPWGGWLALVTVLVALLWLAAVVSGVGRAARRAGDGAGILFLLAWLALPLLFFSVRAAPIFLQYLTVLWPAPFLLAARPLALLWRRRGLWPLAAGVLLAVGAVQVGATLVLRDHLGRGEGTMAFGVPLARWQVVAGHVQTAARSLGETDVYVLADGSDPAVSGQPAVLSALLPRLRLRFAGEGNATAFLLPAGRPALYLVTVDAPLADPLLARWGELLGQEALGEGMLPVRLYRVPPLALRDIGGAAVDVAFANGLRLGSADLPQQARAGDVVWLRSVWQVEQVWPDAAARDWTTFVHLLDAGGQRFGQFDGFGHPSRFWLAGDLVVQWHPLAVDASAPAGTYHLLLGVYSRSDGVRALAADGRDAVRLGPLQIAP